MSAALDTVVATARRHGKYAMTLIGNNLDVDTAGASPAAVFKSSCSAPTAIYLSMQSIACRASSTECGIRQSLGAASS